MSKAKIYYHDIGDYLSREEKLKIIKDFKSMSNLPFKILKPNEHGDWINKRNDVFETFIELTPVKKFDLKTDSYFVVNSRGFETARDAWIYSFSAQNIEDRMTRMISFYNSQVDDFKKERALKSNLKSKDFVDNDETKISWSSSLISQLERGNKTTYQRDSIINAEYRPFCKQKAYNGDLMIHRTGQWNEFFPNSNLINRVICIPGVGNKKDYSILIVDKRADLGFLSASQCFPLYYYEERQINSPGLFDAAGESEYIRRDGVSDFILERAKKIYGKNVNKEDIFYYVYGVLHSPDYRTAFENDLKKMLPRIPLVEDVRDFWKFSKAGRKLADLHINYEEVPAYEGVEVMGDASLDSAPADYFKVQKMRFPKKNQKDTIIFNSKITISNIPEKAYEYVVNGKSAIEWIMERYAITIHKASGIKNDPNDWAEEVGNPRYILDLLLSIINVSVQTVDIVKGLPKMEFEDVTLENVL